MESSKRPRTPGSTLSSSHNVQCLVDGCNADLNQCRDYHRRHKVCEFHSKSPTVTISGREQRFCQQCSRFHLLVEFDEVKRSCRKRLDGHNKRRRKPQPDHRNTGLVLNSQQVTGTRLMSFSTPQICPSGVVSNSWTSTVKTENDYVMYNNNNNKNNDQTNWNSSSNTCRASSSAHYLQVMQQNNEPPGSSGYGGEQSNSSNQKTIFTSDSALSLLSSQSAPSTMEVGFNPMVLNNLHHHHHNEPMLSSSQSQAAAATAQVVHSSQFSGVGNRFLFGSDVENKSLVSETDDSHVVSSNDNFQIQEMFQNGPDESSGSGSHQTLTFLWE